MDKSEHEVEIRNYAVRMLFGVIGRLRRRSVGPGSSGADASAGAFAVTALTRKTAVVEIFRQSHNNHTGSQMQLTELMAAWPQTGLRAADLAAALNEMLEEGSLRLAPHHHPAAVMLSESGKQWLDGAGVDAHTRAEQLQILHAARQRQENQPAEDVKPRIVDRRVTIE